MTERTLPPQSVKPVQDDMRWLERYARRCEFAVPDDSTLTQAIRRAFGAAAWRIVCRSPKACFLPILRNRQLSIRSLIAYCQRLATHSFVQAPQPVLLGYFLTQRRMFYNLSCRVPTDADCQIMRVADRCGRLRSREIALVSNWADQVSFEIGPKHKWTALVRRARAFREQEKMELATHTSAPWHFYCTGIDWRGFRVEPLTNSGELWLEGASMGSCLYRIRRDCLKVKPSRFFSVRRFGKRIATLELVWRPPQQDDHGMDRELGSWFIQDLRLSFNRLPNDVLLKAMEAFATMFNLWSKRPNRMANGERESIRERIAELNGLRQPWRPSFSASL